jgi:hypothetical protein
MDACWLRVNESFLLSFSCLIEQSCLTLCVIFVIICWKRNSIIGQRCKWKASNGGEVHLLWQMTLHTGQIVIGWTSSSTSRLMLIPSSHTWQWDTYASLSLCENLWSLRMLCFSHYFRKLCLSVHIRLVIAMPPSVFLKFSFNGHPIRRHTTRWDPLLGLSSNSHHVTHETRQVDSLSQHICPLQ